MQNECEKDVLVMFCQKCGAENTREARFCAKCGDLLDAPANGAFPIQNQGYQQQPGSYQQPAQQLFFLDVYSKSFGFLFKKPVLLWGLSLLCALMSMLAVMFCVIPLIWLPVIWVLQLGMANIFLSGYRGQVISSTQLFEGFSKNFFRNAGGMGWRSLWILIWCLIPIVGPIFAIIKTYSYRFVPYIMLNEPDIAATEALKKSMAQTKGYKFKMFLTDFLIVLAVIVLTLIFFFIMRIPYLGPILFLIYYLLLIALLPLLMGTISAVCYDKISKENPVR